MAAAGSRGGGGSGQSPRHGGVRWRRQVLPRGSLLLGYIVPVATVDLHV